VWRGVSGVCLCGLQPTASWSHTPLRIPNSELRDLLVRKRVRRGRPVTPRRRIARSALGRGPHLQHAWFPAPARIEDEEIFVPRFAPNKMPAAVKRRYCELLRTGLSGSQAARQVSVSELRIAVVHRRWQRELRRDCDQQEIPERASSVGVISLQVGRAGWRGSGYGVGDGGGVGAADGAAGDIYADGGVPGDGGVPVDVGGGDDGFRGGAETR
jgi:hypothetical protein